MPAAETEPVDPSPPRFRWLKRLIIIFALFYAVIIALYIWWDRSATTRINTLVEFYRMQGNPMLPEDFDSPPIPDSENAVVDLHAAVTSINYDDPRFQALLWVWLL